MKTLKLIIEAAEKDYFVSPADMRLAIRVLADLLRHCLAALQEMAAMEKRAKAGDVRQVLRRARKL